MSTRLNPFLERLRDLTRLARLENNLPFFQLVVGYALGGGRDLEYLTAVLFILGPCLYGGLYALNDVHDYRTDRLHPKKRSRPVAAGRISPPAATAFGLGLIAVGLAAAALFDLKVFGLALLFVALNLLYTFWLKTVPFVEIAMNAVTHPLRFVGGLWLAGHWAYGAVVVAGFLAVLAVSTLKRLKEMREAPTAARPVLRSYTAGQLSRLMAGSLLGVLALFLGTTAWDQALIGAWLAGATVTVIGYLRVPVLRRLADSLWR